LEFFKNIWATVTHRLYIIIKLPVDLVLKAARFVTNLYYYYNQPAADVNQPVNTIEPGDTTPHSEVASSQNSTRPQPIPMPKNTYIHGTTSSIFATLAKTKFKFMSPMKMLESYGLAPMGGEITGGGLITPVDACNPCFGILKGGG